MDLAKQVSGFAKREAPLLTSQIFHGDLADNVPLPIRDTLKSECLPDLTVGRSCELQTVIVPKQTVRCPLCKLLPSCLLINHLVHLISSSAHQCQGYLSITIILHLLTNQEQYPEKKSDQSSSNFLNLACMGVFIITSRSKSNKAATHMTSSWTLLLCRHYRACQREANRACFFKPPKSFRQWQNVAA